MGDRAIVAVPDLRKTLRAPSFGDLTDLHIVALPSDNTGCGHYRILNPMEILRRRGASVYIMPPPDRGQGKDYGERPVYTDMFAGANVVLLQKGMDPGVFDLLPPPRARREMGMVVIYEADDDYFNLDPRNPASHRKGQDAYRGFGPKVLQGIERTLKQCDACFVSTPELAARWSHRHPRIFVLPNSIDFSIRAWNVRMEQKQVGKPGDVVIGWGGGVHHIGDEEPLIGVLRPLVEKYPHVHIAVCSNPGISAYFLSRWGFGGLKRGMGGEPHLVPYPEFMGRWTIIEPVPFAEWPFVQTQWDVGLAPLADVSFNRCKSYLRLLEYGAHGGVYVAQKIAPYYQFHRETGGIGGYLAGGKSEWRDALVRLIEDDEDRRTKSEAIKGCIFDSYNLDSCALRWASAMRQVLQQPQSLSTWTPRERPGRNDKCPCGSGLRYKKCACYGAYG